MCDGPALSRMNVTTLQVAIDTNRTTAPSRQAFQHRRSHAARRSAQLRRHMLLLPSCLPSTRLLRADAGPACHVTLTTRTNAGRWGCGLLRLTGVDGRQDGPPHPTSKSIDANTDPVVPDCRGDLTASLLPLPAWAGAGDRPANPDRLLCSPSMAGSIWRPWRTASELRSTTVGVWYSSREFRVMVAVPSVDHPFPSPTFLELHGCHRNDQAIGGRGNADAVGALHGLALRRAAALPLRPLPCQVVLPHEPPQGADSATRA